MLKRGTLMAVALLLSACTPKLEHSEVKQALLEQPRGLLGGVEFGDSWEKIKADHDKRYEVRDEKTETGAIRQLRRDLGSSKGTNGYYIGYNLDEQKNVKSYSASIHGQSDNAVVVRQVLDDVIAHFDKKVGGGRCGKSPGGKGNSSNCNWPGKDGGPNVSVMYLEMTDPISGMIHIEVNPPAKQ
jgi:hypothetical protein